MVQWLATYTIILAAYYMCKIIIKLLITSPSHLQAARLCIAINGGIRRTDNKKRTSTWSKKDTKVSSSKGEGLLMDRPLHWVNMQILDHRALLRQGVLKLNLWPYQGNGEDSRWGGMSPVGSTAINPDGNNAAVLYIELDSYMHPVACPTEGWGVQSV